jgi:anti-anti-sigma factor
MIIKKTLENGKVTFTLDGSIDANTAQQLQDVLIPAFDEAKEVELDCTKLAYVSSAGLRVLLIGLKAAKAKGASIIVSGVPEEVMDILKISGFADMLTFKWPLTIQSTDTDSNNNDP